MGKFQKLLDNVNVHEKPFPSHWDQ